MTTTDHLFAGALAFMSLSLLFRKAPSAAPHSRRDFYASAALTGCGLGGLSLLVWHFAERPLAGFGLVGWVGDPSLLIAAGLVWVLFLLISLALVKRGLFRNWLHGLYTRYEQLMPRSRAELAGSWVTSVAAGAGEEIVYRGFLVWYGTMLVGTPASLLITSLLFGVAHGYQSRFGVIFATIAGLVLGGIYLGSGSLLLVMWMHATYNMASFTSGWLVLREEQPPETARPSTS